MTIWRRLRARGVLGINARNIVFTQGENPRRLYPLVDDKLRTKRLCEEEGLPVAKVLAMADRHSEVKHLVEKLRGRAHFVIKPARGAMGNGILVLGESTDSGWFDAHGAIVTESDLTYHAQSIISGLYALAGKPDVAFAEERLVISPDFEPIIHRGVPDIRIIVYRGIPVMAMTRLPTSRSKGKANLHQGAVGAGIDLVTGRTTFATIGSRAVTHHPDTGESVVDFLIPRFDEALGAALRATDRTGLGYVGADVVIDATRGPTILELNARPGLAIQLANRAGLLLRLEAIQAQETDSLAVDERLSLGRAIAQETTP